MKEHHMRYTNRILWLRIVSTECFGSAKALYVLTSPNNCSTCIQYFAWPINVWWSYSYSLLGSNVIISSSHEKHPQSDIRRLDLVDSRDIWRGLNQLGSSFRAQMASNTENVSIWWHHHVLSKFIHFLSRKWIWKCRLENFGLFVSASMY